ncbi:AMP-binding protein [Brevibacterium sp. XM4083]|uniref:AMP-binding protein n=1 Tax=Brevibacterium sp. XM4083 TaxID=2583238 RepID=UPI0011283834|nr:AMP-binding protein [Brevibacterium sp. XM4083]
MNPRTIPDTDTYRSQGWWRDVTFLDDLDRHTRETPLKTALIEMRPEGSTHVSYHELSAAVDIHAETLLRIGIGAQDVVAVQLGNRRELPILLFACMRVGAVFCPIAPECPTGELSHRLTVADVKLLITSNEPPPADADEELRDCENSTIPTSVTVLHVDALTQLNAGNPAEPEPPATHRRAESINSDDPTLILFTSGTTGFSKGVVHTSNTLYAAIRAYVDILLLTHQDVTAITTPLVHYSGIGQGILGTIHAGATAAFTPQNEPEDHLQLISRNSATLVYGPPKKIEAIAALQQTCTGSAVDTLTRVVVGTAPVLPRLLHTVRHAFRARVFSVWGLSEFGPITTTVPLFLDDKTTRTNGRPADSVALKLEDFPPATDGTGRLYAKGASRAITYAGTPDKMNEALDADGWFDTGDLARRNAAGEIKILGRATDSIVRDGKVAPIADIEASLLEVPSVNDAVVLSRSTADDHPIVTVVLVARRNVPLPEVQEALSIDFTDFPIDEVQIVPEIPRTLTGKARKAELRTRLEPR